MTGYAFVEFEEERDAEDAVYELNGKSVNGESVNVDYATVPRITGRGRSPGYSSRRRYDDDYDRGSRYGGRRQGGGGRDRDGRDRHDKYESACMKTRQSLCCDVIYIKAYCFNCCATPGCIEKKRQRYWFDGSWSGGQT